MLELWGRANAYNVMKPLWLLAELGLEYRHYDVGSQPGDLETPEFLALNPQARVPVLRDGDAVIWESNSVLRYLANRFEACDLYPQDALKRSQVERWMDWELASLQPAFIDLFWGFYRKPPAARDAEAIDSARLASQRCFQAMDRQLQSASWLGGDDFSLADIACGVCLYRYFNMGFDVERPAQVLRWYEQLSQRPGFQSSIMQPFGELEGRTDF